MKISHDAFCTVLLTDIISVPDNRTDRLMIRHEQNSIIAERCVSASGLRHSRPRAPRRVPRAKHLFALTDCASRTCSERVPARLD